MIGKNLALLKEGCRVVGEMQMPGFWAADFNTEAEVVQQTQVLKQINGVILRSNRVKSCSAGKKQSNIDFFIAFGGTDALVESVEARLGTTVKTHRPVRVVLFSNPQQLRMRTMKIPPPMGKAPVIGPKASRSFDKIRQTVRTALQMAMEGDRFTSSKALNAMYGPGATRQKKSKQIQASRWRCTSSEERNLCTSGHRYWMVTRKVL